MNEEIANQYRLTHEKENAFLQKLFPGNILSSNKNMTSIEIPIDGQKVGDIDFDFDLSLFHEGEKGRLEFNHINPIYKNQKVTLKFANCIFKEQVFASKQLVYNISFDNCLFKNELSIPDLRVESKLRFRKCTFDQVNFKNTVFTDLLDFWSCLFTKEVIFFKTDFLGTTSFAASEFQKNVLFTYSLLEKHLILRGSKFRRGLDLSVALKPGTFDIFDLELGDYNSKDLDSTKDDYQDDYEACVAQLGEIPTINKRETFRFLKQTLETQSNVFESIQMKSLEKEVLRRELQFKFKNHFPKALSSIKHFNAMLSIQFDRATLYLNSKSNLHGKSYSRAACFVALVGWLFFYLSMIATDKYRFSFDFHHWPFDEGFKLYIQFLIPTHSFDYLGDGITLSAGFYFWDFAGRIAVSYGIYQFIQAFRKFR